MQQQLGSKKDKLSKLRPSRPDAVQNQEEEEFQRNMQELAKLKEKNLEMARAIGELGSSINIMSDVRNNELIYQQYLQRRMQIQMTKYVIKKWSQKKSNIDRHQIQKPQPPHIIALNSPRRIVAEPQRIIDHPSFSLKEQNKLMKNQPNKSQKNIVSQNDQLQEKKQKIQEKPKPQYDQKQINSRGNLKGQLPEKNLVSNQSKGPANSVKNAQKIPQRPKNQLFVLKPYQDKQNEKTNTFNQSRQPVQKQIKNQNNQTLNRSNNPNQPAQNLHQPPNNQPKQNKEPINKPNPQNQQVQSLHQVQNKSSNQNNRLTTVSNQPAQPQIKRSQSTGFSLAQPLNSFFNMLIGGSRGAPILNNQKANDQNRLNIDNKSKANLSQPKDHNAQSKTKDQEKKQNPSGSIFGALQKKPEPKTDNRPKWR